MHPAYGSFYAQKAPLSCVNIYLKPPIQLLAVIVFCLKSFSYWMNGNIIILTNELILPIYFCTLNASIPKLVPIKTFTSLSKSSSPKNQPYSISGLFYSTYSVSYLMRSFLLGQIKYLSLNWFIVPYSGFKALGGVSNNPIVSLFRNPSIRKSKEGYRDGIRFLTSANASKPGI